MEYIKKNKKAWENAFDSRSGSYAEDLKDKLLHETNPFLHKDFLDTLPIQAFENKNIAQYCCNNGRELLQLSRHSVSSAVGFDLAENMVAYANTIAKDLSLPAKFIQTNILEISSDYNHFFDYGIITVGAICWFENLHLLFKKIAETLKPGATLYLHEIHPFQNMLATPSEPDYNEDQPKALAYDYFIKKVWEEHGMGYMSNETISATFTSFSHSLSSILNALTQNHFEILELKEYDYCVGNLLTSLNHQGIPLSMILTAKRK